MGQRFQAYLILPVCNVCQGTGKRKDMEVPRGCNCCDGTGYKRRKVVGIHHQWLYGHTAIKMCERTLKFLSTRAGSEAIKNGFDHPAAILQAIYSCVPEEGYYHPVLRLDHGEPEDPRLGDNNDGITVIDARDIASGKIRYCFMSLQNGAEGAYALPCFKPVSAKEYVESYYPPETEKGKKAAKTIARTLKKIEKIGAELLTTEQLVEIFPLMTADLVAHMPPATKRKTSKKRS